jgi:hypothetical protein
MARALAYDLVRDTYRLDDPEARRLADEADVPAAD